MQASPTVRLLVVTARPRGHRDVGDRTISRPLIDGLGQARVPVQVDLVRPETYRALVEHLRRSQQTHGVGYSNIVHCDPHVTVVTYQGLVQVGGVRPLTHQDMLKELNCTSLIVQNCAYSSTSTAFARSMRSTDVSAVKRCICTIARHLLCRVVASGLTPFARVTRRLTPPVRSLAP